MVASRPLDCARACILCLCRGNDEPLVIGAVNVAVTLAAFTSANGPVGPVTLLVIGAELTTVNVVVHWVALLVAPSLTVIVISVVPSPTIVPAAGFWEIIKLTAGVQLSDATT